MVLHFRATGLVFKQEDRQDADRVFSVATQELGRIEVLGRGIRKIDSKLRGGMELFCISEIEFVRGRGDTLVDAWRLRRFLELEKNGAKAEVSRQICSLLDRSLRGHHPDIGVANLAIETLEMLDGYQSPTHGPRLVYFYFLWNLAARLGYAPQLFCCALCAGPLHQSRLRLSFREGGMVCARCAKPDDAAVSADLVKIVRVMLQGDWNLLQKLRMPNAAKAALAGISEQYISYHIPVSAELDR